jgi:predicted ATPase/DNA-binding CsgD family transcriptional regulator
MSRQFPSNLPNALSSFIGRGHEINKIKQLFSTARLVTLTGPGGCGKTRLGLWVAAELGPSFRDGVWLVEFAPLADPELVTQAVCTAVGVREHPGLPLIAALTDYVLSRNMLLVLDNCEHVIVACAELAEALLHTAPRLQVLATSREALYIAGEMVWLVPPLSVPESPLRDDTIVDPTALMKYESPRLFVERASAVSASFTLTEHNAAAVAEICQRLDGMPLAIELAAALVRALSVEQIATRLATHDRFRMLTTGSRTAPQRQQTLEATLDWSYALLSETERNALRRLSVFAGGWTLDAAEAVFAGADTPAGADGHVLDVLSHLVDKSMAVMDTLGDEARYHFLETIRQYARGKLAESVELEAARDRHLEYFVRWAEQAESHLAGAEQHAWLNRLEAEHDNLRAALDWSQTAESRAEQGLRLAIASVHFWMRSYLSEGRMHIAAALAHPSIQKPQYAQARARALSASATMAFLQSDYPATRSLVEEGLALLRPLDPPDRPLVADLLTKLGDVATEEGNYAPAHVLFEEALATWQELKDAQGQEYVLILLGWCDMRMGDYALAENRLEESLAFCRKGGNANHIALVLAGLGETAVRQGRYERATQLSLESLALRRERGDKWGIGTSLGTLGWVALRQHDFKQMRTLLRESMAVRTDTGDISGIAWCLEKLAQAIMLEAQVVTLAQRATDLQRATTVLGAAAALRTPLGSMIDLADQHDYEQMLANLHAALGESSFAMQWAAGSRMSIEQAVDVALHEPQLPTGAQLPLSARELKEQFSGLTAREREVAALIGEGKSNRQIAEALVVSAKTAETYVTRILDKLGFGSRVQIATWAAERGLAPPAHPQDA